MNAILTRFSLLMPTFSLLCSPQDLAGPTSPRRERSPTNHELKVRESEASVLCLAPYICGAEVLDQ